uniref:Uncharacterized protein n=1 Tax=Noctiluca scintillans TaxID=2966 RepID=A0A7S1FBK9_NOCSC
MVFYRAAAASEGPEQLAVIEKIIEDLKAVPEGADSVIEKLSDVKTKLADLASKAGKNQAFSVQVGEQEARELKFKENQISELVFKLREKSGPKPSTATLQQMRRCAVDLSAEIVNLDLHQQRLGGDSGRGEEVQYATDFDISTSGTSSKPMGISTIVHAAGVLADGLVIPNQGKLAADFSKVWSSKAHSAWHFHQCMPAL